MEKLCAAGGLGVIRAGRYKETKGFVVITTEYGRKLLVCQDRLEADPQMPSCFANHFVAEYCPLNRPQTYYRTRRL